MMKNYRAIFLFKLKLKTTSGLADTAFINKLFKKLLGLKTKRVQTRDGEDRHWIYELASRNLCTIETVLCEWITTTKWTRIK